MLDYRVPTIQDSPPIEVGIVESNDPHGPFGAKEAGEGSLAAFLPALTNAIADAIGVRFNDLPVTPDRVFAAIEKRASAQARATEHFPENDTFSAENRPSTNPGASDGRAARVRAAFIRRSLDDVLKARGGASRQRSCSAAAPISWSTSAAASSRRRVLIDINHVAELRAHQGRCDGRSRSARRSRSPSSPRIPA